MAQRKKASTKKSTARSKSTDLEAHVNAPGRAELVKQERSKIKQLGVTETNW